MEKKEKTMKQDKQEIEEIRKRFEEKALELSYKHDNEITLAIDDLWKYVENLLHQREREAVIEFVDGYKRHLKDRAGF